MPSTGPVPAIGGTPQVVDVGRPRPYLRLHDGIALWEGRVEGDQVVITPPSARTVELEGQEFLRFRSLAAVSDVETFASEYGLLGLYHSTRAVAGAKNMPLWARCLVKPPNSYGQVWEKEPVEDWIRQAGLVDVGVGLLGLVRAERLGGRLRQRLMGAARNLPQPTSRFVWSEAIQEQRSHIAPDAPWEVRSILDGAARAGLLCEGIEEQTARLSPSGDPEPVQLLSFGGWPSAKSVKSRSTASLHIPIAPKNVGRQAVATTLAELLDPWLGLVRAGLVVRDATIRPAQDLPTDFLSVMWLQLINSLFTEVRPRRCRFPNCPGPPNRPGVFLWQWRLSPRGSKHRDAEYCHPKCREAHKQAMRRAREKGES